MTQHESHSDYYAILGADERASRSDIDKLYKRLAARRHPDRGGSEEEMKLLNEAYATLKDEVKRKEYDTRRVRPASTSYRPVSGPPAQDIGVFGHCLSAFLCLMLGLFLLFLVRIHWFWFLWPLAILAVFVILFGIMMARSAMVTVNAALPITNPLRGHTRIQEIMFWGVVAGGTYGVYLLLTSVP